MARSGSLSVAEKMKIIDEANRTLMKNKALADLRRFEAYVSLALRQADEAEAQHLRDHHHPLPLGRIVTVGRQITST